MNRKKLDPSESELHRSASKWLKVLSSAGKRVADEVPPGYKTVVEIAAETGKSNSRTNKTLREALKLGLVESRRFNIPTGDKLYPVPHYRICNSPKRSA